MTINVGELTLKLDEFLSTLTPDLAAELRAYTARHDVALSDQIDATADHVRRNQAALVAAGNVGRAMGVMPDWARLEVLRELTGWLLGTGETCLHAPDPRHPRPIAAVSWRPGLITCGQCTHLLRLPRESDADRTCDGCGHVTDGVDTDDPIWPGVITFGPLTYGIGVCTSCRWWDPS